MPDLVNFTDFIKATAPKYISDPQKVINDAVSRSYEASGLFNTAIKGRPTEEVCQGGSSIKFNVLHSSGTQNSWYKPNDQFGMSIDNGLTTGTVNWRYNKDGFGWTDQMVKLQANGEDASIVYTRIAQSIRAMSYTSLFEQIENSFVAAAVSDDMEASTGAKPYSLRAFITEAGALPQTADGASGTAWTTVCGISDSANWRNQVSTFANANIDTDLLPAFDEMAIKTNFKAPGRKSEYFQDDSDFAKRRILTDLAGIKKYMALTRDSNDRLTPANDPGWVANGVSYRGMAVEELPQLTALSYAAPRFFWPNFKYIYPVVHTEKYMAEDEPVRLAAVGQPESYYVFVLTWMNWVCTSRKRQGIIVPT